MAEVMDHTQGLGADYGVEAVGQSQTLLQSVEAVQLDGEVHWFGLPSVDENIPFSFAKFFKKRVRAVTTYGAQDEPGSSSFQEALDLIHEKKIDVSPLLSHRYPIEDINQAMEVAHLPVDENIPFSFAQFFKKRVRAVTTYGSQEEPGVCSFKEALSLIHEKKIDVLPLLSHRFPIEDINQAMDVAHKPVEDQALKVSVHFD